MNGKGDKPRPIADREDFNKRFENINWNSKKDTESSNGRTADFGSANLGSNPSSVTKDKPLDKQP